MSHDTLIHRIVRPAVRALAQRGVTPNQLTTLRLASGLAAAAAFAAYEGPWLGIGAAIFLFSMLLDRADGELARQTGSASAFGHWYDLAADCASGIAAFIGLGCGLVGALGPIAVLLGLAAGGGIGALFWQLNVLTATTLKPYSLWHGRVVLDLDDAMILVPVLIWCGVAQPMLMAASAITPAAALWLALSAHLSQRSGGRRRAER